MKHTTEYRCPGEEYPISRAVHLGRLARFYPGCRQCPHRDDTGTLSARRVRQLLQTRRRGLSRPLFDQEGIGGVYLNELTPHIAQDVAAALGVSLRRRGGPGNRQRTGCLVAEAAVPFSPREDRDTRRREDRRSRPRDGRASSLAPVVVIASDGRPIGCELVAAVAEGLRWAGCGVVDIGPATAACLAFAIDHLAAGGGVLVGNPGDGPHTVGLKFWAGGPWPLSAGRSLDALKTAYQAGLDRPTRSYGWLRRFQADGPYLAGFVPQYHALRPLRFVLACSSDPMVRYLCKLTEPVACRIIPCRSARQGLPAQILAEKAHFAARVDDDGETCQLIDEEGRHVPAERLLLLLARHLLEDCPDFRAAKMGLSPSPAQPPPTIVLEQETTPRLAEAIAAASGRVVLSDARRSEMAAAMCQHGGRFGGGGSGRFWYAHRGPALPDGLMTLTLLLKLLSQSDRPLSTVLDQDAALG